MRTMPDNDVILVGKDVNGKPVLLKFSLREKNDPNCVSSPETPLYSTSLEAPAEGLVPVTFGDRPCLGVLCYQKKYIVYG